MLSLANAISEKRRDKQRYSMSGGCSGDQRVFKTSLSLDIPAPVFNGELEKIVDTTSLSARDFDVDTLTGLTSIDPALSADSPNNGSSGGQP